MQETGGSIEIEELLDSPPFADPLPKGVLLLEATSFSHINFLRLKKRRSVKVLETVLRFKKMI